MDSKDLNRTNPLSRRTFIGRSASIAAGMAALKAGPFIAHSAESANEKLGIALSAARARHGPYGHMEMAGRERWQRQTSSRLRRIPPRMERAARQPGTQAVYGIPGINWLIELDIVQYRHPDTINGPQALMPARGKDVYAKSPDHWKASSSGPGDCPGSPKEPNASSCWGPGHVESRMVADDRSWLTRADWPPLHAECDISAWADWGERAWRWTTRMRSRAKI